MERNPITLSDDHIEKKSLAMYKSTGEQVGHLMFKKSGIIKDYENKRKTGQEEQNSSQNVSYDTYEKQDILSYEEKEAKDFFVSREEQLEKEKQINEVIKSLQQHK